MAGGTVTLQIIGDAKGALKVVENFSGQVKKELGAISAPASTTQQRLDAMGKVGTVAFKAILTGAVAAGTAIAASLKSGIDYADQIQQVSQKTGIAAESLSGLQYAAGLADVSMNSLSSALGKLAKAQVGNLEQFKAIGVETRNLDGSMRDTEAVLLDVADVFQKMPDGAEKSKLAMDLFGKAGRDMIPMLNEGSAGIRAATEEAKAFGLVVSGETAAAADKFNDNLSRLSGVAKGFGATLAEELLPALNAFTDDLVESAKEGGGTTSMATKLAGVVKDIVGVFISAGAVVSKFGETLAFIVDIGGQVIDSLSGISESVTLGLRAAVAFSTGQFDLGNKLYAMSKEAGAKVTRGLSDGIKNSVANLKAGWDGIDKDTEARIAKLLGVVADGANAAGAAAGAAAPATNEYADALEAARRAAEAAEPAVTKLNRAVGAQIEVMGTATEKWKYSVEDLDQTLVPFFTDFDVGVVEAGERYAEFGGVVQGESSLIGDAISQMVDTAIYDWDHMGDAMVDIARNFLSQIAQMFLSQNFQLNAGMGMGGGGGGGGYGSLLGGGGGAGGVGGWFSGAAGQAGVGLGAAALSILGPAALLYAGATQGPGWGAAAGAGAGALFASTAFGASVIGGSALAAGSAAATGASLGSVVPVIGTIIGAVVGLLAGYFMQEDDPRVDVIGGNVIGTSGNMNPRRTFQTAFGETAFSSVDSMDSGGLDALQRAITDFDASIAALLLPDQLATVSAALADFDETFKKDGITPIAILEERFSVILGTFSEDIQAFVREGETLQEQVQILARQLGLQQLNNVLDALTEENRLAGMTELERQIEAVNAQFDALVVGANNLEAGQDTLARIEELRAAALGRLTQATEDNTQQLQDLLGDLIFEDAIAGLSDYEQQVARVNARYDELYDSAKRLGASQEQLAAIERTRARELGELTDAMEDFGAGLADIYQPIEQLPDAMDDWRRAMQQVQDFITGERYSATSTLTPEQMLQAAQGDFAALLFRAQSGDANAAGGLAAAAQRLLELGRGYYASGDEYDALRNSVLGSLSPFGNLANNPSSQLHDAMNALRTAFVQFGQYLQEWNNRNYPPGSAANGANYAGGESAMVGELRGLREEMRGVKTAVSAAGDKQASAIREGLKRGVG